MAPSDQKLEAELRAKVREVMEHDRGLLTVNHIRKLVTDEFDLDESFFLSSDWKARSKTLIKNEVVSRLLPGHHTWVYTPQPRLMQTRHVGCH